MVQLQLLSGARPQEVISVRPCEVNTEGEIWLYQPSRHKTEHFDRRKVIMLGPKAQAVLKPWLDREPESYCFNPAEVVAWHRQRSRRNYKRQNAPQNEAVAALSGNTGIRYTRHSYRVAIQRACRRAGVPAWSPRQLRHTRATMIRHEFGLEAAKAVLGHTDTKVTEIYAERDLELAARVMREIG
jgi:integrase